MKPNGYKMTTQIGTTYFDTIWGEGITHKATGTGNLLCTSDCIHDYATPYHAVLLNPVGANFQDPILWEGRGESLVADDGTKKGWRTYTTLKKNSSASNFPGAANGVCYPMCLASL